MITAVPEHEWEVQINAPARTDFEVHARTSYGERLGLLYTTHDEGCATKGNRLQCFGRFAIGANVRPTTWTVIVNKHSNPAATVHVQVTFQPLA
ncbi:MAG: hypothetical protein ACRDK2_02050 [Solirubrobacteraceae bacterium]